MKDITLKQINDFVREHNMTDALFCELCKLQRSWLSKLRDRSQEDDVINAHKTSLANIHAVLDGKVPIPNERRRPVKPLHSSFCPPDYDVTHLVKRVQEVGRNITFKDFQQLCYADWNLKHLSEKLGLL